MALEEAGVPSDVVADLAAQVLRNLLSDSGWPHRSVQPGVWQLSAAQHTQLALPSPNLRNLLLRSSFAFCVHQGEPPTPHPSTLTLLEQLFPPSLFLEAQERLGGGEGEKHHCQAFPQRHSQAGDSSSVSFFLPQERRSQPLVCLFVFYDSWQGKWLNDCLRRERGQQNMEIRLEGAGRVESLEPLLRNETPPEEASLGQLCPAGPLPSELTGLCGAEVKACQGLSTSRQAAHACLSRRRRRDVAPACPLSLRGGTQPSQATAVLLQMSRRLGNFVKLSGGLCSLTGLGQ